MQAYHYTVQEHLESILSDQMIMPAIGGVPNGETPVVWFSTQPIWEPTASKMLKYMGKISYLTTPQMFELFAGQLVRLGISTHHLLSWVPLTKAAHISRKEQRRLLKTAKKMGADHMRWYGHLQPVLVHRVTIENWVPENRCWDLDGSRTGSGRDSNGNTGVAANQSVIDTRERNQ